MLHRPAANSANMPASSSAGIAQFFGLAQRCRVFTSHHVAGFLLTRPTPWRPRFPACLCRVAAERGGVPVGTMVSPKHPRTTFVVRPRAGHAAGARLLNHLAVVGLLEEGVHAARHDGPSGACSSCSSVAADSASPPISASRRAKVLAGSLAVDSPTCLMPSANKNAAAWFAWTFPAQPAGSGPTGRPCAPAPPGRSGPGGTGRAACGSRWRPPAGLPACRPGPSMSMARRAAKCRMVSLRWAAQNRPPVQRWLASPFHAPPAAAMGHWRGMRKVLDVGRRGPEAITPTTGNHAARRTITWLRARLLRISNRLCNVALVTVTPPTNTGPGAPRA